MSPAATVEQSQDWARKIVNADVRGPGDLENAMRRVESRFGIPFAALWALRYRPPRMWPLRSISGFNRLMRRCARARCGNIRMNLNGPGRRPGIARLLFARLLLWLARMFRKPSE